MDCPICEDELDQRDLAYYAGIYTSSECSSCKRQVCESCWKSVCIECTISQRNNLYELISDYVLPDLANIIIDYGEDQIVNNCKHFFELKNPKKIENFCTDCLHNRTKFNRLIFNHQKDLIKFTIF